MSPREAHAFLLFGIQPLLFSAVGICLLVDAVRRRNYIHVMARPFVRDGVRVPGKIQYVVGEATYVTEWRRFPRPPFGIYCDPANPRRIATMIWNECRDLGLMALILSVWFWGNALRIAGWVDWFG